MQHRIRRLLPLHTSTGFALLAAVLLGACAATNPEATRTKNLLSAAGFTARKPETPEARAIFSQMPAYTLEGGLIGGTQLYTYKDPAQGAVYVGGETEFQQYERLYGKWKQAHEKFAGRNPSIINNRGIIHDDLFGTYGDWLQRYLNE